MANQKVGIEGYLQLRNKLGQFVKIVGREYMLRLEERLEQRAEEIEVWMQENAPWEDRTGKARASLRAELAHLSAFMITMTLMYDDPAVHYDKYLENMQAGRFSILKPAFEEFRPVILSDIKELATR